MARNLSIRVVVRHRNIPSVPIRREGMKILAWLIWSPDEPPKNQLSSWKIVDSQKSMELPVSFRQQHMAHQRVLRIAVREGKLYSPALAKIRMETFFASR